MPVRTPDPDPNERDDEGTPRDPLGGAGFGPAVRTAAAAATAARSATASFGSPTPDSASNPGWLTDIELAEIRRRMPILYVEAVPVRTDGVGAVTEVGILLRATPLGEMTRTIVSGRVRYGETVRDALFRHLENDLGPMAFPLLPPQPVPFTVAEYFPMPGVSRVPRRSAARRLARLRRAGHRHVRAASGRARGDVDAAGGSGIRCPRRPRWRAGGAPSIRLALASVGALR